MTALEIILTIALWIIIGVWISYKRDWYDDEYIDDDEGWGLGCIIGNVVFMPAALIIAIFRQFISPKWNN